MNLAKTIRLIISSLVIYLVIALVITVLMSHGEPFKARLFFNSIFTFCVATSIRMSFYFAEYFFNSSSRSQSQQYFLVAVNILVGSVVGLAIGGGIISALMSINFFTVSGLPYTFLVCLVTGAICTLLFFAYERLKENIENKARENESLKQLQIRTEVMALQSKLNPHFLFNTLNTMLNLVHDSPAQVERMILGLSDIYRKILTLPESNQIRLAEEFSLIEQYLEIEQIRLGSRLEYSLALDPALGDSLVPPMLIEPLVENAVIHGIGPLPNGGRINVSASHSEGRLVITVTDNGIGFDPGNGRRGFGIFSIQERLRLLYHDRANLQIARQSAGGTTITVELPEADT